MKDAFTKDTTIKTNMATILGVISAIFLLAVTYTVAINRIGMAEQNISKHDTRIEKLEQTNNDNQKILIEMQTDLRYIKENIR